jgi:hypothetical protein
MFLEKQLIMTIGITQNGWELTKEMINNSINTFAQAPIVLNSRQEYKNYNNPFEDYLNNCTVIGVISSTPNIIIEENNVYADILLWEHKKNFWKDKFDNWCIEVSDDKKSFKLQSIEVF